MDDVSDVQVGKDVIMSSSKDDSYFESSFQKDEENLRMHQKGAN